MSSDPNVIAAPMAPAGAPATATAAALPPGADQPVIETVIRPSSKWRLINVRELWQARDLLYFLVWRDIKVRYKQTLLGAAWAVLQPLMMMVVFTVFFGKLANLKTDVPYPVFVYAGLLPWTFFATAISNAGNSVVGSERLITKVYFPRLAVPFASVGAAIADFAIAFGLLVALMAWYGIMPGPAVLLAPVFFAIIWLTAMGVGTLLSALNVAYRDFRYVIPFLVQLWMFATPTVYMQTGDASSGLRKALMVFNPMASLIGAFRASTLGGSIDWPAVAVSAASAAVIFFLGCLYFRKVEDEFADLI